jgi:DNA-binding NarL/FixJ family response regulator
MPKKNGIECLKEIRGNEHFKDLIIVMFSSIALKEKIEEAFYNGANIFLLKSNDVDLLYAAVQKIVLYTHLFSSPPFSLENFIMKVD